MLRKLCRLGLCEESPEGKKFRRTALGDAEIEAFDSGLPSQCLDILSAVAAKEKCPEDALKRGLKRLVDGGLVRIGGSGARSTISLTWEGERVAEGNRAHGPAPRMP